MSRLSEDALTIHRLHLLSPNHLSEYANAERPPREIEQFIEDAPVEQLRGALIQLLGHLPDDGVA